LAEKKSPPAPPSPAGAGSPPGSEKGESELQKIATSYRSGWGYAEYAFQYAAAIVICTLLGWWIDSSLGTTPLFIIIGVFAGAAAGFIGLLTSLKVWTFKKK
jgi:F0F1-type ATP synthase assembly protein I